MPNAKEQYQKSGVSSALESAEWPVDVRAFRQQQTQPRSSSQPLRLIVDLPLPVPKQGFVLSCCLSYSFLTSQRSGLTTSYVNGLPYTDALSCLDIDVQVITLLDEGDWPGGIQQKCRYLKPMVDDLLYGYVLVASPYVGPVRWL